MILLTTETVWLAADFHYIGTNGNSTEMVAYLLMTLHVYHLFKMPPVLLDDVGEIQ